MSIGWTRKVVELAQDRVLQRALELVVLNLRVLSSVRIQISVRSFLDTTTFLHSELLEVSVDIHRYAVLRKNKMRKPLGLWVTFSTPGFRQMIPVLIFFIATVVSKLCAEHLCSVPLFYLKLGSCLQLLP